MSDYSKITNFSAKDALITGDPNKLVKGVEHDAEYNAIATAIATKFDSADIATDEEAEAGASNAKLITPANLAAVLAAFEEGSATQVFGKDTTTSRTTTATPASDPDLITGSLAAGTYIVEVFGAFRCNGGSQGYAVRFGGSSTIRANNPADSYALVATLGGNLAAVSADANYPTVGVFKTTGATSINPFRVKAKVVISVGGTLAFQWSQASSDATATELLAGATMTVEQVA